MWPNHHTRFDLYAFFIFFFPDVNSICLWFGSSIYRFTSLCLSTTLVLSTFNNSVAKLSPLISRIDTHLPFPIYNPWDVCLWISPLSICYSNHPQWHAAFIKMSCICHHFNNLLLEHQAHITWGFALREKGPSVTLLNHILTNLMWNLVLVVAYWWAFFKDSNAQPNI